jgi:hypothetical protein
MSRNEGAICLQPSTAFMARSVFSISAWVKTSGSDSVDPGISVAIAEPTGVHNCIHLVDNVPARCLISSYTGDFRIQQNEQNAEKDEPVRSI